jgi:hypothetical protein
MSHVSYEITNLTLKASLKARMRPQFSKSPPQGVFRIGCSARLVQKIIEDIIYTNYKLLKVKIKVLYMEFRPLI